MPYFTCTERLACPVAEVFDFFCRPANLPRVSPPEMHLRLLEAPERLQLGAYVVVEVRRWGIAQRLVNEVVVFEPDVRFVDAQRSGPFRKWVHSHRFEALPEGGTLITDEIDFEPPGGLVGLVVTAAFIEKDLRRAFAYRSSKLAELLGGT